MRIIAPAKINLFLHVVGKYNNGYHQLESMFAFCNDLYDEIEINPASVLTVQVAQSDFPEGYLIDEKENIVYKVLNFLGLNFEVKINKKIPLGAGLGGGSCDVGAILNYLLQNNYIEEKQLASIAKFGADILPCIKQKCCIGVGVGDEIVAYPNLPQLIALVVKPSFNISTIDIYKKSVTCFKKPIEQQWEFKGVDSFKEFIITTENSLLEPIEYFYPVIKNLIENIALIDGCFHANVSGSGSACFGLFDNEQDAILGKKRLSVMLKDCQTYVTKLY